MGCGSSRAPFGQIDKLIKPSMHLHFISPTDEDLFHDRSIHSRKIAVINPDKHISSHEGVQLAPTGAEDDKKLTNASVLQFSDLKLGTYDFSVVLRVKFNEFKEGINLFCMQSGWSNIFRISLNRPDNQICFCVANPEWGKKRKVQSPTLLPSVWYNIGCVVKPSGDMELFLDGKSVKSDQFDPANLLPKDVRAPVERGDNYVGRWFKENQSTPCSANFMDVLVVDRALDAPTMQELHSALEGGHGCPVSDIKL